LTLAEPAFVRKMPDGCLDGAPLPGCPPGGRAAAAAQRRIAVKAVLGSPGSPWTPARDGSRGGEPPGGAATMFRPPPSPGTPAPRRWSSPSAASAARISGTLLAVLHQGEPRCSAPVANRWGAKVFVKERAGICSAGLDR